MGNAVLNIGAVVDKDAIVSGMAEGAAGVKTATANISVYFQDLQSRASSSWKKISEDTRVAASSVSAESLRIAEATKAASAAHRELAAAVALTRNPTVEASAATALHAAAIERDKAAVLELAAATKALNSETERMIPEQIAASAAIRSFEGNPGIRAVEFFVSNTLGLRGVLTNLFPIVGALAFLAILVDMGEKVVDLAEKALKAGSAIAEAFSELHDKATVTNDDLQIQSDKLQDEIDKLSGHPGNGFQTALDEAIKRADDLLVKLREDIKAQAELFKQNEVGFTGSLLTGVSSTKQQAEEIQKDGIALIEGVRRINTGYKAELAASHTPEEEKVAGERHSNAIRAAFQQRIDVYKAEATRLREEQAESERDAIAAANAGEGSTSLPINDNSAKVSNIEGVIQQLRDRSTQESLGEKVASQQAQVGQIKQDKAGAADSNKEDEIYFRQVETELKKWESLGPVSAAAQLSYWKSAEAGFKEGSEKYLAVVAKEAELVKEISGKVHEAILKGQAEIRRESVSNQSEQVGADKAIEDVNRLVREQAEDATRTGERWQVYNAALAKGSEISARLQEAMQEGQLRILEQEHGISALGAAQVQARIHADEHTRALRALRDELAALQAVGAGLKPGDKGYEQNVAQQQNVQNQITQEQGQAKVQGQADQGAINAAIAKPYLTAFNAINAGWMKVQRDLIQGNRNISRDFAQMGLGLVQTMAQNFEKMLVQQLQIDAQRIIAHRAANAATVADDGAAAATSTAIKKTSALEQMFIDAKKAATGAFAAITPIPFVGPVLAPIAAGAAFAGVMALAAFEQGGIVGGGGGSYQMGVPILAHAGERVLSYDQTQKFEGMVNGRGGGGETHIHNYGGNNFSQAGNDFKSQWAAHERHIVKRLKTLRREGKL